MAQSPLPGPRRTLSQENMDMAEKITLIALVSLAEAALVPAVLLAMSKVGLFPKLR